MPFPPVDGKIRKREHGLMFFLAYCARHLPSDARVAVSSSAEVESNSRYSRGAHGCDGIPALDGRQPCRTLRHESDFLCSGWISFVF